MLEFLFKSARLSGGRKAVDLEAKLAPVAGFTGRGEVEFSSWANGSKNLEVELRGVAGRHVDLYVDGVRLRSIGVDEGFVDAFFDTNSGDAIPDIAKGAQVEIFQNGQPILSGVMRPDQMKPAMTAAPIVTRLRLRH